MYFVPIQIMDGSFIVMSSDWQGLLKWTSEWLIPHAQFNSWGNKQQRDHFIKSEIVFFSGKLYVWH